jgi:hypothetical protein
MDQEEESNVVLWIGSRKMELPGEVPEEGQVELVIYVDAKLYPTTFQVGAAAVKCRDV